MLSRSGHFLKSFEIKGLVFRFNEVERFGSEPLAPVALDDAGSTKAGDDITCGLQGPCPPPHRNATPCGWVCPVICAPLMSKVVVADESVSGAGWGAAVARIAPMLAPWLAGVCVLNCLKGQSTGCGGSDGRAVQRDRAVDHGVNRRISGQAGGGYEDNGT